TTIQLRPLYRLDLPGFLAAEVGANRYLVEYRPRVRWDSAIPESTVLLHRFQDNHSYIIRNSRGWQGFGAGDFFERGIPGLDYLRVEVLSIDDSTEIATVRLRYDVPRDIDQAKRGIFSGQLLGGVAVDGGGAIIVNGRIIPIPPWDPFFRIVEQIVLY